MRHDEVVKPHHGPCSFSPRHADLQDQVCSVSRRAEVRRDVDDVSRLLVRGLPSFANHQYHRV